MRLVEAFVLGTLIAASGIGVGAVPTDAKTEDSDLRPISARTYARVLHMLGDRLEADWRKWALGGFQDPAEAARVFTALSPDGERARALLQEVLRQLHVTGEQVATFVAAHPEVAEREGRAFGRRMEAVAARLAPALTAAQRRRAQARRIESSPAAPEQAAEQPVRSALSGWTRVRRLSEIQSHVTRDRAVILVFRADWAIPSLELERKVLARPDVSARLADYTRLSVEVDHDDPENMKALDAFGVSTLPAVLVYSQSRPLQDYLQRKGPRPPAALVLNQLVSAEELLERLPR